MKEKRIGNRKLRMTILEGVERERHRDGWIPEPKVLPLLSMMFTVRKRRRRITDDGSRVGNRKRQEF